MCFRFFVIISSWKKTWPFIWTNLNSLHPRMLCTMQVWFKWPSGSGEEDETVKSLQSDGQTDDRRQAIRKACLNFQLRIYLKYIVPKSSKKYICIMITNRIKLQTKMLNTIHRYYLLKPGEVFDIYISHAGILKSGFE